MPTPGISLERDANGRIVTRTLVLGNEAETRRYAYDSAGRLARVTDGEASFLIVSDHLGTPVALADLDGNIVQTMQYDAFGPFGVHGGAS